MDTPEELQRSAAAEIAVAESTAALREIESRFLGKSGSIPALMKLLGGLDKDERPAFGQRVNGAKNHVQALIDERAAGLRSRERLAQFEAERIDVTMPGDRPRMGYEHILQLTTNKIKRVLGGLGFQYLESPELEEFRYNFDALNYPPDHPAMDDQDTFYVDDDHVLRTQCTALQGRVFESTPPPLRCFTVGRTYRNEAVDRTHNHTFHQVDCFMIDEGVSMAHLKGTLGVFARAMFGEEVQIRFRPDFFPFVEPGVDYAISTPKLFDGRWVELGGAGLIHPNILERYGIDTERYSGFAFGLGVERIPMMAYGIDDLRLFLENDLRFLEQFRGESQDPEPLPRQSIA
ncbi:phenylalanine--tRNA ligase subunit alpha [Fimbriimonas ginsengisoli]|uniref:Phenylalanine--tRNA ligase alpha subunit n=1 Tax=Fimbriimonas ginsengisoli Gsoil 348 TaxID=661478 RepID=A0A068NSJ4_FIMGI|nr:phenylalanine--tRNA ligase subunit alpha [Fimbriimonas ginsengisoli]AIE86416.1 phenylalanyl-tRNA synthetase subunit alpha [Fimbriimonas ginsengisoli Gsoil 348]